MGIIYHDPEDSYYDEAEFAIVKGNTVFGNLMDDVRFYGELALVREGIEESMKHYLTISTFRCGMFEKQCIQRR